MLKISAKFKEKLSRKSKQLRNSKHKIYEENYMKHYTKLLKISDKKKILKLSEEEKRH